jgi:pre-rRNA-processing protein TSR3
MNGHRVVVIRHARERIRKCSLRFLHGRPEFTFLRAGPGFGYDATGHLLLELGAPPLTAADRGPPILLLDSSWRWLESLQRCIAGQPIRRSLPAGIATAYPRRSRVFEDPPAGLASVEALYVALRILGTDDPSLLEGYHWKEQFLRGWSAPA